MKVRIGNDIPLTWAIPDEDLTGRSPKIYMYLNDMCLYIPLQYTVDNNVVSCTFYGKDQPATGSYNLLMQENRGGIPMTTYDTQNAVELVAHSWEEDDETPPQGVSINVEKMSSSVTRVNKRIGNDIPITWALMDGEGNPYDLSGETFTVGLKLDDQCVFVPVQYAIDGNVISFTFFGKDQPSVGVYDLVIRGSTITFDAQGVVELVRHSWLQEAPSLLSTVIRDN